MTAEKLIAVLRERCGVQPGDRIVAAVSGGVDSMALLLLLCDVRRETGLAFACAHVDHGVRPQSDEDLSFVQSACARLSVPFYGYRVDVPAHVKAHGGGVEAAARALRYDCLRAAAKEFGAAWIALAHHRGDQAETVLMHALRGSGLAGLSGMRMRSGDCIRPLLETPRETLLALLVSRGEAWREDETNEETIYTRNKIRHCVLPECERAYPGAQRALCRLADNAQRDEDFLQKQADALDAVRRMIPLADGAAVAQRHLAGMHPAMLSRVLLRMTAKARVREIDAAAMDALMREATAESAAVQLRGALARMESGVLCINSDEAEIPDTPLNPQGDTMTPFGRFCVTDAPDGLYGDGVVTQSVPEWLLRGAVISTRREGDRMTPFGMHSPVRLKKLMIDAGVPLAMRRSVPVVRRGEEILWAVGLRPSQRCRAEEGEKRKMIVFCGAWPDALGAGHVDQF